MPPSLCPLTGIEVFTGDGEFYKIEYADYMQLTNTLPGTELTSTYTSIAAITSANTGVLEEGQTYTFTVYPTGDLPMNSYFTLAVPSSVGLPSTPTLTCSQACTTSDITLSWDSSTRLLTFSGIVKSEGKYIMAPGPLQFSLAGFTNPATSANAYFKWTSYAVLSTGSYMIDQISSMYITA
jgi:hypothetical protein